MHRCEEHCSLQLMFCQVRNISFYSTDILKPLQRNLGAALHKSDMSCEHEMLDDEAAR